jgi:hypothetical protein
MQKKEVKNLEDSVNMGPEGMLPKSKQLSFKPGPEGIIVTRKKRELAPVSIWLNNKEYKRTYPYGNPYSEVLVRANLEKFVEGVRAAVKVGLDEERLVLHPKKMEIQNSIWDVEKICIDFDGMSARGFVDTNGKPLSRDKAFRNAIRQFFKDEAFAKAVCLTAAQDYLTGGI